MNQEPMESLDGRDLLVMASWYGNDAQSGPDVKMAAGTPSRSTRGLRTLQPHAHDTDNVGYRTKQERKNDAQLIMTTMAAKRECNAGRKQ